MPPSSARVSCVLDTDVVIDVLRRQPYAQELLRGMAHHGVAAISTMTHLEVFQGMKPGEEDFTRAFLDGLASMAVTVQIARAAGTIRKVMRGQGISVSVVDAVIGATALHLDVPLVTNNVDHYAFPSLRLRRAR